MQKHLWVHRTDREIIELVSTSDIPLQTGLLKDIARILGIRNAVFYKVPLGFV